MAFGRPASSFCVLTNGLSRERAWRNHPELQQVLGAMVSMPTPEQAEAVLKDAHRVDA
jgi:hypothetical protein